MENCIQQLGDLYVPFRAIINYTAGSGHTYFECCDFNAEGKPKNAHALSLKEASRFAAEIYSATGASDAFLFPKTLITERLLFLRPGRTGMAVWFTPPQQCKLYFSEALGIPTGTVSIPGLIWKATPTELYLFAFKHFSPEKGNTPLYHAPFFNFYRDGRVCMGDVPLKFSSTCSLEDFIAQWQAYFFNSYFTHLIDGHLPVTEIAALWKSLSATQHSFPLKKLKPTSLILNNLIP